MPKLKQRLNLFLFLIFFLILVLFNACTPAWVNKQQELKNVIWKTEDTTENMLTLEFLVLQDNANHFGYIEYNNQRYEISLDWGNSSFDICAVNYYGQRQPETTVVGGGYNILDDTQVELEILYDYLFNGALVDKRITVKATAVDPKNYGAFDRHELRWQNESVGLEFFVYQCYRRFGVGTCNIAEEERAIVFYWRENNRFEIFELIGGVQSETCLLSGTYTDDTENSVTLQFEANEIFDGLSSLSLEIGDSWIDDPDEYWYPAE